MSDNLEHILKAIPNPVSTSFFSLSLTRAVESPALHDSKRGHVFFGTLVRFSPSLTWARNGLCLRGYGDGVTMSIGSPSGALDMVQPGYFVLGRSAASLFLQCVHSPSLGSLAVSVTSAEVGRWWPGRRVAGPTACHMPWPLNLSGGRSISHCSLCQTEMQTGKVHGPRTRVPTHGRGPGAHQCPQRLLQWHSQDLKWGADCRNGGYGSVPPFDEGREGDLRADPSTYWGHRFWAFQDCSGVPHPVPYLCAGKRS